VSARRTVVLRWLPAIAWMAVIFALSSISGLRVSDDAEVDRPFRVVAHLGSYALLAGLLLFALAGAQRPAARHVALALGLAVLYGLSDEIHQAFVPSRTGRLDDVVTDSIGAVVGLAVAYVALTWWGRRSAPPVEDSEQTGEA
jgi:VanZ family protein